MDQRENQKCGRKIYWDRVIYGCLRCCKLEEVADNHKVNSKGLAHKNGELSRNKKGLKERKRED